MNKEIRMFYADAARFVLKPFSGFIYCPASVFIKSPAGGKRYNVPGAVNAVTEEIITVTNTDYISSLSVCELTDRLKMQYIDLPIYMISDNAGYQKNHSVMNYAESPGITSVRLPPYSPRLNLTERVRKFIKKKVLYSKYYKKFQDFMNAADQCIRDTDTKYKDEINSLPALNFQDFSTAKIKP